MTVHNYRSRKVHEILNGVHPSIRDIRSTKSGFRDKRSTKFLANGQAHMGQMGKWPWQRTTRGLDNSTELRMEKIRQAVTEIWVPQIWQSPAQPPARTVTTNWSYNPETLNSGQNWQFFVPCDPEIDEWPFKTTEHLFYAIWSFVHHLIAISQFKLELQSLKRQILFKIGDFFVLCDPEIWRMTLKNNRAPLLCYFKLCASFHSH